MFTQSILDFPGSKDNVDKIVEMCCLSDSFSSRVIACEQRLHQWVFSGCSQEPVKDAVEEDSSQSHSQSDDKGNIYIRVMAHMIYMHAMFPDAVGGVTKTVGKPGSKLKHLNFTQS